MKSVLTLSVLGLAVSSLSFGTYADQMHGGDTHRMMTGVEHYRMETELNGPKANDWLSDSGIMHLVKTSKTASEMGHTAVQHARMKTEDNGPHANNWVIDNSSSHLVRSGPTAGEMGHTAVQHSRMKTEDNGPRSNAWVVSK